MSSAKLDHIRNRAGRLRDRQRAGVPAALRQMAELPPLVLIGGAFGAGFLTDRVASRDSTVEAALTVGDWAMKLTAALQQSADQRGAHARPDTDG